VLQESGGSLLELGGPEGRVTEWDVMPA